MTKKELITRIAKASELSKYEARQALQGTI
jgi:nucleoid DNA-binding protein